jgi:hypothetical protein
VSNQGTLFMFMRYTKNYSRYVYIVIKLIKNSMINSCDIIWLNNICKARANTKSTAFTEEEDVIKLRTVIEKTQINL